MALAGASAAAEFVFELAVQPLSLSAVSAAAWVLAAAAAGRLVDASALENGA
jgi:hypothetical protein